MAITVSGSFIQANNKAASTLFTFGASASVNAGDLAIVFIGTDSLSAPTASRNVLSLTDNILAYEFGGNGTLFNSTVRTAVSMSDGSYIMGGDFTSYNGTSINRIIRLSSDGTMDATFDANVGTGFNNSVYRVAIQPQVPSGSTTEDKIVVIGNFTQFNGLTRSGSVRLNMDGTLDTTFKVGTGLNNTGSAILVYPTSSYTAGGTTYDSKIILGGNFTTYSGSLYSGSVVVLGDGTIDTVFKQGVGFSGSLRSPGEVKALVLYDHPVGAWTAGGALITVRNRLAGAGTQNAALAFGGQAATELSCTEEYNGSTWTAVTGLITARYFLAGAGTQNAALAFGGLDASATDLACTEAYNGTSWTAVTPLIAARYGLAGAGIQNAALAFGGAIGIPNVSCTEEYNGSTWATGGALITARQYLAGTGTQNAALAIGGTAVADVTCTEAYNGSTWTAGGALITAVTQLAGAGTQNAALAFGGDPTTGLTQAYNGSTWTAGGNMISGRFALAGAGTQTAALAFGGISGVPSISCTEAYNITTTTRLLATGNFTAYSGSLRSRIALINVDDGTLIPTSSFNIGTAGLNSTGSTVTIDENNEIIIGGTFTQYSGSGASRIVRILPTGLIDTGSAFNTGVGFNNEVQRVCSYNFNVASNGAWSTGGALITARSYPGGAGTQTAALAFGGIDSTVAVTCTEAYDGSTWTAVTGLITARFLLTGVGTQNAALAFGGVNVASCTATEAYNGSIWTAGGALITARYGMGGAGTQNAALAMAGFSTLRVTCTEEYNGSTWATGGAMITARTYFAGAGTQNAAVGFGGNLATATFTTATEEYNGTTWAAGGALIQARDSLGGAGTQTAALAFAGSGSAIFSCTEAYNGTSWLAGGVMNCARFGVAGVGTDTAALAFAGQVQLSQTRVACTEAYNTVSSILAGGIFTTYSGSTVNGFTRLKINGLRDTTFNVGAGFSTNTSVEALLVLPNDNDKILTVGDFTRYSASFTPAPNRIVLLNSNATIAATPANTWTKANEYNFGTAAGAGASLAMFYSTLQQPLTSGSTTFSASLSGSITAKAAVGYAFNVNRPSIESSSASGSNLVSLRMTQSNLPVREYLFIRGMSYEGPSTATITPTTGFTQLTGSGTTGGGNATNITVRGEFRIISTASLFTQPTWSAAANHSDLYFSFYENVVGTYFIFLD